MRNLLCLYFFWMLATVVNAQDLNRYNPIKAQIKGGAEALEQVLQTQLTLPKNFFQSSSEENINVYFLLDSALRPGKAIFLPHINLAGQRELQRLLQFFQFYRYDNDLQLPYYVTVPISSSRYQSYRKQKEKSFIKPGTLVDSSYVIHTKADQSPEFYKDAEEGLKEFLLSEMEFPRLAIEKSVAGTVIVEFVVETNGYVSGLHLKQALGAGCSEEALRLIKLTRWKPARKDGKLVRYRMSYPITFSLRSTTKDSGFQN